MSDIERLTDAEVVINTDDLDRAWSALHWVFCSTDLEPDGFFQTMSRMGLYSEQFKSELLDRSRVARVFYYGSEGGPEALEEES